MQRVTITLDDDLMQALDRFIERRGYDTRSEAIRDLVRAGLGGESAPKDERKNCVAALIYTYDHDRRDLSKRLTHAFHDHHDLALSTLHVHLDKDRCMEVTVLKGRAGEIRHFADHLVAERGVRYGQVVMVPDDQG